MTTWQCIVIARGDWKLVIPGASHTQEKRIKRIELNALYKLALQLSEQRLSFERIKVLERRNVRI